MTPAPGDLNPTFRQSLQPGESIEVYLQATNATVLITDRRLAVEMDDRLALDIPIMDIRRIQFDLERDRPATLVLVPEHPRHEPQVIAVPLEQYDTAAAALIKIGKQIYNRPSA